MRAGAAEEASSKPRNVAILETNITMEIAQLLLSLLHAWGMEPELDRVCETKLGLLRPMVPVSFGVISKGGKFKSSQMTETPKPRFWGDPTQKPSEGLKVSFSGLFRNLLQKGCFEKKNINIDQFLESLKKNFKNTYVS